MTKYKYQNGMHSLSSVNVLHGKEKRDQAVLLVQKKENFALCPSCGMISAHVHEKRVCEVYDRPVGNKALILQVQKRRFICENSLCETSIFTEDIPGIARRGKFTLAFKDFVQKLTKEKGYLNAFRILKEHYSIPISLATVFYNQYDMPEPVRRFSMERPVFDFQHFLINGKKKEAVLFNWFSREPLCVFSEEEMQNVKRQKNNAVIPYGSLILTESKTDAVKFLQEAFPQAVLAVDCAHAMKGYDHAMQHLSQRLMEALTHEINIDRPLKNFLKYLIEHQVNVDEPLTRLLKARVDVDKPVIDFLIFLKDTNVDFRLFSSAKKTLRALHARRYDVDKPALELFKFLKDTKVDARLLSSAAQTLELLHAKRYDLDTPLKENMTALFKYLNREIKTPGLSEIERFFNHSLTSLSVGRDMQKELQQIFNLSSKEDAETGFSRLIQKGMESKTKEWRDVSLSMRFSLECLLNFWHVRYAYNLVPAR